MSYKKVQLLLLYILIIVLIISKKEEIIHVVLEIKENNLKGNYCSINLICNSFAWFLKFINERSKAFKKAKIVISLIWQLV